MDKIIAYEEGTLSHNDTLELFAELVNTGQAWTLQGHYGRAAMHLIEAGCLNVTQERPLRVEVNPFYREEQT